MLAVLPFQNLTGDSGEDYFSDGMTEEMIAQLGNLDPQHVGVIARTSVMHYKNSQTPLHQVGRELGVQYVIEGSVRRDSNNVRVTAQLIQTKDQTHVWARQYDRELRARAHLIQHAFVEKGMFAEARAALEKERLKMAAPWYWYNPAYIYGRLGQTAKARYALHELLQENHHDPVDARIIAWVYAGFGDKDQAIAGSKKLMPNTPTNSPR
jgi:TolB-like protein